MPWFNVAVTWRLARIRLVRYRGSQSGGGDQRWQEDVRGEDLTKKIEKSRGFLKKAHGNPGIFPYQNVGVSRGKPEMLGGNQRNFPNTTGSWKCSLKAVRWFGVSDYLVKVSWSLREPCRDSCRILQLTVHTGYIGLVLVITLWLWQTVRHGIDGP